VVKPATGKEYIYYRCARYNAKGHPRIRLNEAKLDEQVLALLARLKQPDAVRHWFADMLRLWIQDEQQQSRSTADDPVDFKLDMPYGWSNQKANKGVLRLWGCRCRRDDTAYWKESGVGV
jgi:hypothetical protein